MYMLNRAQAIYSYQCITITRHHCHLDISLLSVVECSMHYDLEVIVSASRLAKSVKNSPSTFITPKFAQKTRNSVNIQICDKTAYLHTS